MASSQGRQNSNYIDRRTAYAVEGTAARKLQAAPKRRINTDANHKYIIKNRQKAKHMNLGYVAFVTMMMVVTMVMLVSYVGLTADITSYKSTISQKQVELNNLKLANDAEYSRIMSDINLEEIRNIAIADLHMNYAEEGQIEFFSSEDSDYVRQVADIPEE